MRHFIMWAGSALAITVLFTTPAAAQTALAASAAAAANDMVRYSFCTDSRTDRSTGRIREVIYYSAIGTVRPGPDGGITFPTGFADFVDTQTNLQRQPMSENCPLFETIAQAEQDLALKRRIERPGIRDFVYLPAFVPGARAATRAPAPRSGSKWTRGSGKLGQTPIGDLANPILVNGDQVMVPMTQPGDGTRGNGSRDRRAGNSRQGYQTGRMNRLPEPPAPQNPQFAAGQICPPHGERVWNPPCAPARDVKPNFGPARNPGTGSGSRPGEARLRGTPPPGMELHLEAVTVCQFVQPWAKTNYWRCRGPLQITYVNFSKPNWLSQLRDGGGSNDGSGLRDLGLVGGFRVFGWSFPLYAHPDRDRDAAILLNAPTIPTRLRYWCPHGTSKGCMIE